MKKRVLSMLLAFTLCFSTVPMTAFAQGTEVVTEQAEQEETQDVTEPAAVQEEVEAVATPETPADESTTAEDSVTDEEIDIVSPTEKNVSGGDAGEQDTEADSEKDAAVQAVQALIDALPDEVTVENADELQAQLMAIDEAMDTLTEEQIAALNMERYEAVCAALTQLVAVQTGEHTHYLCGGTTCNGIGGHTENGEVAFTAWNTTWMLPTEKGNYYLMDDVTLSETWIPKDGVVLCLNGHTITVEAGDDGITVGNNKTFTLCDCLHSGKITHGTDGNGDKYYGSGVCVSNGTFNMYDGSITENEKDSGAGVNMYQGTFNMYGGNITKNTAKYSSGSSRLPVGGGVSMETSTFNMYDGAITYNTSEYAGGLEMTVGSVFNMSGGTIANNSATGYTTPAYGGGGGVNIVDGTFNMSGGTIKNNQTALVGGGVNTGSENFFNMTGGEITDNQATKYGGGVYAKSAGYFTVSGSAKVSGNTTSNVYLPDGVTIAIGEEGLASDARIGVTTEKSPAQDSYVAIATGAENGGYKDGTLIADQTDSGYKFQQTDDQQILLVNGTLHTHPLCGNSICSEHGESVNWMSVSTEAELRAVKAGTTDAPSYYYLRDNITLTNGTWTPADNVVLCLNGKSIIADGDFNTITCQKTTFTLTDCGSMAGEITHTSGKTGSGVAVVGNSYSDNSGSFIMYGGSIAGNTVTGNGGGVYIDNTQYNKFTMYGGSISGNKADGNGGGIYALNGKITMTDDTMIVNNTAGVYGGGVHIGDGSSTDFEMSGGRITDNKAGTAGGGVYVGKSGSISMSGVVIITGNTITDGKANNVYLTDGRKINITADGLQGITDIGVTTQQLPGDGNYITIATGAKNGYNYGGIFDDRKDPHYTVREVGDSIVLTRGEQHRHAICGKSEDECVDGHYDVLWQPLTYNETDGLKYGVYTANKEAANGPGYPNSNKRDSINVYTLPAGNYYLTENITIDGTIKISGGDVNLCLNGYTLSTSKVSYAVLYTQNNTLTVSDCGKNGCLNAPNNGVTDVIRTSADTTTSIFGDLYIYGGSITGSNCGVRLNGTVYMYGGSITGNGTGVEARGITIGGNANITSNTVANVNLMNNRTVTIDKSLTQSARIGITTYPAPTKDNKILIATGANTDLDYFEIFTPDVTDKNYAISKVDENLYLGIHQHSWTYTADGAAIRIWCEANGCNLDADFAVTYTVTQPEDLSYSGSGKTATVTVSDNATGLTLPAVPGITYQKESGDRFEDLIGEPTDVGTYKASITLGEATASVIYTINSKKVANPTITVDGTYTYDGTEKKPTVVVKDGTDVIDKGEYSVSYANNTNAGTATVTITDVAGGNYDVSGSETFTIGKATITVTPEADQKTIYGMADPKLEYKYAGVVDGEEPAFTGALSRDAGKDAGNYAITLGTLALADNTAGSFKAANYELKLAENTVQFEIVPKPLTAADLEFTTDSIFTKTYDKTTACTTATVQISPDAIVDENDVLPTVAGTYVYNSENVKDADKVIFTSEAASAQNYILPAGLTVEHEAKIDKAAQSYLIITPTTVPYGTDFDLTTIVSGGSGTGEVTYSVTNGSGVATITGSILHPVKVGEVTVVAVKAADDNHYQTTSSEKTITISKGNYSGTASKTVNIVKNRSTAQTGIVNVADFFPDGQIPEDAKISQYSLGDDMKILSKLGTDNSSRWFEYTSNTNITGTEDQICTVIISSTNYNDITATLTFHPTDKMTVTIDGLTYTDKTYDGSAMEPTGTLTVSDDKVPVSELEVLYEGTSTNGTNYSSTYAPKDAGTYTVTYKVADSNADYTGEVTYNFTISPKAVTAGMIDTIADETYTGGAIEPTPEVKDGNTTLTAGTDFDFSYDKNIDAGENTATVTITGKGNYTGTASKTFTIKPKDISGAKIELKNSSFTYDGIKKTVEITSVTLDGKTLTDNKDYEIKEGNEFISANDSITLTIAGKGNYTGTATTTWKITQATPVLGNFDVTGLPEQTYDGKPKEVTAKKLDGVIDIGDVTVYYESTDGTTYTRSTTPPTNAGTYKVILSVAEGKNYTAAEIDAGTLTIKQATLNVEDVTEFFEYTQTGEQSIDIGSLVPDATLYSPGRDYGNTGILSGYIAINENGILKFTLSELTTANIDNKVTVPVTITSENYEDVTVNVTIYISPEYRIIEGAGSTWTQNTNGTIVIRGDGDYHIFKDVKVDGKVIDHSNYEVTEGSTIITLKAEYLKTLSTGSHTFAIVWNNGIASTNFNVAANTPSNNGSNNDSSDNSSNDSTNNTDIVATTNDPAQEMDKVPATGDPFGIWLTLFVISLTGFAGMLVRRKKN